MKLVFAIRSAAVLESFNNTCNLFLDAGVGKFWNDDQSVTSNSVFSTDSPLGESDDYWDEFFSSPRNGDCDKLVQAGTEGTLTGNFHINYIHDEDTDDKYPVSLSYVSIGTATSVVCWQPDTYTCVFACDGSRRAIHDLLKEHFGVDVTKEIKQECPYLKRGIEKEDVFYVFQYESAHQRFCPWNKDAGDYNPQLILAAKEQYSPLGELPAARLVSRVDISRDSNLENTVSFRDTLPAHEYVRNISDEQAARLRELRDRVRAIEDECDSFLLEFYPTQVKA